MPVTQVYNEGPLEIQQRLESDSVALVFGGKSILRDPSEFVLPILLRGIEEANSSGKRLLLDFRDVAYMNSSTFTPIIKVLEKARVGDAQVTVLYAKGLKWQEVSFTALTIFQTRDGRIEVRGAE